MSTSRILGVIPARYASSRLPGKPLADIAGRSMVMRVVDQARSCLALAEVVVATDDDRVFAHVLEHGGKVVMTSKDHPSGTDRCAEALALMGDQGYDAVVNIQGDEPFIVPAQIDELCRALAEAPGGIATLAQVVTDDHDLDDPGEVLITTTVDLDALYFSRAAIPFLRLPSNGPRHSRFRFLKHVGLYAFRSDVLGRLVTLAPSPLELAESLEQLRWLEHGHRVRVGITGHASFCVDTPADLEEARRRALLM
ncbi:MAG: 3-deoxy-manno-octulosonate cytidylyltransferase [Flavobacteriales bacterium]|jgi:3-deoxy-manno-octulosonate cytidylyltransferase (CMP-KDO synthetase)|nr:3-deoxy-manno-octulosonate cytidylyltransferase [Flavobacteriales bacterium]HOZ40442.1 3-deoxy-manno-octulosonate cytidylyltransferase [Flavobacteriales bacterium]